MVQTIQNGRRVSCRSNRTLMEALEARAYFDLVPSFTGVIPTDLIATVKNKSVVTVDLTNNLAAKSKGSYTVTLLASTSPVLGAATDTPVSSITKPAATFAANQTKAVKFKLSDFPDVASGDYFLFAEVTGSLAGVGDNVAVSATAVAVTDPFIDLTDSVTILSPASDQVLPGKRVLLAVEVFNNGNIPASGPLLTDVDLTANGGLTLIPIKSTSPHIKIKPMGHQILHLSEKIPAGFTPGTYSWDVTIDANDSFNESDTANNTAVSAVALTVLPPYPNLLGLFIGPDIIKKGPAKGATVTLEMDFTSESQATGAVAAAGTLIAAGTSAFDFSGTITTKGKFSGLGSSSSSIFVATYTGKLVGNKLSGKTVNTDGNSGIFTLTRFI